MNKVKKFFNFIYQKAIGEDIETIKYMHNQMKEGKPILNPEKKKLFIQSLKEAPMRLLKESWIWILVVIFVFGMGYLVGLTNCEVQCNNFIAENYAKCVRTLYGYTPEPDSFEVTPGLPILKSNITEEYSQSYNYSYKYIPDKGG